MKTVLIVDDELDIRETAKLILEKNGYKVITAVNGDDCLKQLKKTKPDVILLDVMMPGMPVKEVVEKIPVGIKIIYCTVVKMSEAEKENLFKGKKVVDYIEKPYDIKDMLNRIKKTIG